MGAKQSIEPPPPNRDLGRKFQVDEFRRGDRVLVFSRLEQLGDPKLVEKLRANPLSTSAKIPSSPPMVPPPAASGGDGASDQVEREGTAASSTSQRQADSAIVEVEAEVATTAEQPAEEPPIKKKQGSTGSFGSQSGELPDYPRSVYGWVVLAHDYIAGVYAVQMADGSYIPSLVAEKDFELLIQCDWTRGGIDGDKYPDSVPLSSLELPAAMQYGAAAGGAGGGSPPGQATPVGASPAQSTSGGGPATAGGATLGTINTKTASKSAKNAAELKKKKMLCGTRVSATLRAGKYSGIIVCINSDGTFNVQADFGDYLTRIKLDQVESLEPQ